MATVLFALVVPAPLPRRGVGPRNNSDEGRVFARVHIHCGFNEWGSCCRLVERRSVARVAVVSPGVVSVWSRAVRASRCITCCCRTTLSWQCCFAVVISRIPSGCLRSTCTVGTRALEYHGTRMYVLTILEDACYGIPGIGSSSSTTRVLPKRCCSECLVLHIALGFVIPSRKTAPVACDCVCGTHRDDRYFCPTVVSVSTCRWGQQGVKARPVGCRWG